MRPHLIVLLSLVIVAIVPFPTAGAVVPPKAGCVEVPPVSEIRRIPSMTGDAFATVVDDARCLARFVANGTSDAGIQGLQCRVIPCGPTRTVGLLLERLHLP